MTRRIVYEGEFVLKTPWLKPGSYHVDMFVCSAGVMDRFEQACHLEVIPLLPYPAPGNDEATSEGVVFADFSYGEALIKPTSSAPTLSSPTFSAADDAHSNGVQTNGASHAVSTEFSS